MDNVIALLIIVGAGVYVAYKMKAKLSGKGGGCCGGSDCGCGGNKEQGKDGCCGGTNHRK